MRVLLLTPVHSEFSVRNIKKTKGIPETQGQSSWVDALKVLGYDVSVFVYTSSVLVPKSLHSRILYYFERYFPITTGRLRRRIEAVFRYNPEVYIKSYKLYEIAKEYKPSFILISGGITSILPEVLNKIKKDHHAKVILFSGVNPVYAITPVEKKLLKLKIVDYVVENDSGYANEWEKLGVKSILLPISSVDPKKHKRIVLSKSERARYSCDISFVGSITQDRAKKLLSFKNFDLKFWGDIKPGVKLPSEINPFYMGTADSAKMIKIFNASKVVLNFQPDDTKIGGNMRTFEVCGSGAFQMTDKNNISWFTDKQELVVFKNMKDAVLKAEYYLSNTSEREKIAKAGYKRAHAEHTYVKHFKKLFTQI